MSKFGFDPEDDSMEVSKNDLADRLASFPPSAPKTAIDLAAVDAAAAPYGFISREAGKSRKRRVVPTEPKRQLSVMLPESKYNRFVAYADRHRLTYEEVISRFLEAVVE
jgi:hypothetical protein